MAFASLASSLDPILKEFYIPPVVEQLNNEVLVFQLLDASDEELVGRRAIVPVHKNRSGGIGARGEYGTLPVAVGQGYANAVYTLKYLYGRAQISGPAVELSADPRGAFLQAFKAELDYLRNDLTLDLARQVYGDGTGQVAAFATNASANTLTVTSSEPIRKGFVYINQVIDIGTTANGQAVASQRSITDVNVGTPSVTISGAAVATTSGTHFAFVSGNVDGSGNVLEIDNGLRKLVSSTSGLTVGGINSGGAGNGFWDNLRDTSGGAVSLDNIQKNINQVRVNGGRVDLMLGSLGIQRAVFNALQSQVRYVDTPTKLAGGYEALSVAGHDLVGDRLAPFGTIFMLDKRFIKIFSNRDWHFLDQDGLTTRWVTDQDAWQAALARYINLGVSRRNTHLIMSGLTDATGF
ncbi:MAG: phage major capsid protein [Hyphomicrobiales bacterium]